MTVARAPEGAAWAFGADRGAFTLAAARARRFATANGPIHDDACAENSKNEPKNEPKNKIGARGRTLHAQGRVIDAP